MRLSDGMRSAVHGVLAGLLAAAGFAQEPAFSELRRWRWQSPVVVCGAADAAGTLAGLGRRDASGAGWEVLVWDRKARAELRTVPVARRPVAVRFPDEAHVEVRLADTDAFLSLSRWYRFRVADGAPVGQPKLSRLEDDDPIARRRLRGRSLFGDDVERGPEPCVFRDVDAVSWWQDGVSLPIADFGLRAVELTPDGRFAVVWLPSRLAVIPVAGGGVRSLPVASENVRAIEAGTDGDEILVVTADAVRVWRAASARELRTIPIDGEHVVGAALAPDGGLLALARGADAWLLLLDLRSDRVENGAGKAMLLAWTPDGRRLAGASHEGCFAIDRSGVRVQAAADPDPGGRYAVNKGRNGASLLAFDDGTIAQVWSRNTWAVVDPTAAGAGRTAQLSLALRTHLSPRELVATGGMRVYVCDAASWETVADHDLRADAGAVAVASGPRRVAVVAGPELVVLDVAPK